MEHAVTLLRAMPRASSLRPLVLTKESLGQRLARLRKDRGFTQVELASKMGIIQSLVSDYERDRIRPYPEMLARFALNLDATIDEIVGLQRPKAKEAPPLNRRFLRRLQQVDKLPKRDQEALLRTIDAFLRGRAA